MKRGVFIAIFIIIFVIVIFYLGILFSDKEIRDKLNKNSEINNAVSNENTQNIDDNIIHGESLDSSGSSAGGGGGSDNSGSRSSSSGISENNPDLNGNSESSCVLVRPGNLPDIACSVNYIQNNGVSLNIKNELGEKIDIILKLNSCSPELSGTIENLQKEDFVFSCDNENKDYFNQDIYVTYILSGDREVDIGGFVSGPLT